MCTARRMQMNSIKFVFLLLSGLVYSSYLALEAGIFMGLVFTLMTIGLTATLYILDRKMSYRIIVLIWLAIVIVVVSAYISTGVFSLGDMFRNPIRYV